MNFKDLGISEPLVQVLKKSGITTPTPIQEECIPLIKDYKDVIAQAQTGTGKTLAFLLPLFENISPDICATQALIITPTRELALQITEEANQLEPSKVCLLCTGSQGEPLAALSRIASGSHKQIKLNTHDVVIFSSSPIPGNSSSVSKTINKLYLKGVKVYTNGNNNDIHSSGHANQEELKLMIRLFKPEYFAPYHGEYRMLKTHADVAIDCDIPKSNTFILSNGEILNINKDGIKKQGHVQAADVYVDGSRIGDVSNVVVKDRILMANNGILAIIINIDTKNKVLLNNPLVTTRGYILVNESLDLIKEIEAFCKKIIINKLKEKTVNFSEIKNELINSLMPLLADKTGRVPIILPIIMDVKDYKKNN